MQFKGLTAFVILSLTFFVSAAPGLLETAVYRGGSGPVKLPMASPSSSTGKRDRMDPVHDHNVHAAREQAAPGPSTTIFHGGPGPVKLPTTSPSSSTDHNVRAVQEQAAPGPSTTIFHGGPGPVKLPTTSPSSSSGKRDSIDPVDHNGPVLL